MARPSASPDDADDGALRRAKALSAPTRVAAFGHLRRAADPLSAPQLAVLLGVHHTAVRQHLNVLIAAGLVAAAPQPHTGRGRPRIVYRALDIVDSYRELATALAEAMTSGLPTREIGRQRGLATAPVADGPLATLAAEADRLGFEPSVRRRGAGRFELVLGACPFADAAAAAPAAVCDLHLGIAEGIVERSGSMVVDALDATDPHRGGCRFTLHSASGL